MQERKYLRTLAPILFVLIISFLLSGCTSINEKSNDLSIVYSITTILAGSLLVGCCSTQKHSKYLLLLFSAVFITNIGYLALSLSTVLNEALLANRISYFGSVLLPMSMLFIILKDCKIQFPKWFPYAMLSIAIVVFLVAASPGYSDIYYKSVTLVFENGVSKLDKVYGPWHSIYYVYLFTYFLCMVIIILYAHTKHKIDSLRQTITLLIAVFVNICVWLLEQFVAFDFELLAISYIITELFLINIPSTNEDMIHQSNTTVNDSFFTLTKEEEIKINNLMLFLPTLTATEKEIYNHYVERRTPSQIMELLNIKESTLKYHNRNIYTKLGVSTRKELLDIVLLLEKQQLQNKREF